MTGEQDGRPVLAAGIGFGLMFFTSGDRDSARFYQRLLDLARLADERGLRFISTPERHFHEFGGAFPNPAVLSAAIAAVTRHIEIRAGSLIAPLHHELRIVEDWSVVDNLSGGRAAIAFGTGWNINDFVLAPDAYHGRRAVLKQKLRRAREYWDTGTCTATNPAGQQVTLDLHPRPARRPLRAWLTVSQSAEGWAMAAREGLNVLTHMETQDLGTLAARIGGYRAERLHCGHDPGAGIVTVMQHALIGGNGEDIDELAARELDGYLRAAADLERRSVENGGAMSGGRAAGSGQALISDHAIRDEMVTYARHRLIRGASLVGTYDECEGQVARLAEAGADEIACLIDFVTRPEDMQQTLHHIGRLHDRFSAERRRGQEARSVTRFLNPGSTGS
jgi:natural product biosynthesis luciferase-like monooxygenase protein